MSEIKFKSGTTIEGKTINDGDIVMINNTMGSANSNSVDDKLGSVYKGSKIVGTTKAKELCLTSDITVSNAVGNIINGDELKKGMSVEDILIELLSSPVQYPSCKAASVSYGSIQNKGTIVASSTTPYVGQTVTFTYPNTATATITLNKTEYTNGGSTTSSVPTNTTQAFYTDATGTTAANPSFSISNGDTSWVATWGSGKTVKQQISVDTTVYGAPVLKSDNSFYLPLDSNGKETTKTGKYDADYSVVYAVDENGEEKRIPLTVKKTLDGDSETVIGQLPYAYYKKGSEPTSYSFEKISSGDTKTWNTPEIKAASCPTYIIPYKYKTASESWTNTGTITLTALFGGTTYNFVISAGGTSFSSGTNLNVGSVEVNDTYVLDTTNGTWSKSVNVEGKVAVQFLKVQLMTDGNSTDSADKCTVKIN